MGSRCDVVVKWNDDVQSKDNRMDPSIKKMIPTSDESINPMKKDLSKFVEPLRFEEKIVLENMMSVSNRRKRSNDSQVRVQ